METLINKKIVFNPLSKIIMTTSLIPVCDYWSSYYEESEPIEQRNQMVDIYGNEILENGGELSVQDNGDIYVTRQTEELYSDDDQTDSFVEKDWYFMNMSTAERDIMSSYEFSEHKARTTQQILRRYLSEEDRNLAFTNPDLYWEKVREVNDNTATVVFTVEATVQQQLEKAFGVDGTSDNTTVISDITTYINRMKSRLNQKSNLDLIKSDLMIDVFKLIKMKQLTISAFTDIRTWMFGVAKNFYPFMYFKTDGIYDMSFLTKSPKKLSEIDIGNYDPNNMSVYYKDISTNKKNLMTVCKQTNTEYWTMPEGNLKSQMYGSPVHTKIVGGDGEIYEGVNIETIQHGSYIEYNVMIDNGSLQNHLNKTYQKYLSDKYGAVDVVGVSSQKDTTSQSIFLNDYGFTVPVAKMQFQKQRIVKFEEGEKFVVYFAFSVNKDAPSYVAGAESFYFEPTTFGVPKQNLRFVSTAKVWTSKNYQEGNIMSQWPLIEKTDFKDELQELQKEVQTKQTFSYDETFIDDGYVKGDYYYMTETKQTSSAGFIGVTLSLRVNLPYCTCPVEGSRPTVFYTTKPVTLRQVMSVHDMNDVYQIKDTISIAKYDMLSKFQSLLDMYVKRNLEIQGVDPKTSDPRQMELLFYGALRSCLVDVDYYTRTVFFEEIFPKKNNRIYEVFVKTFDVRSESIDYLTSIEDIVKSEYIYELKTFSGAKSNNQSYTSSTRIQYSPVNLPFDVRDFELPAITINFNALMPTITADYDLGGGFIGKKQYKLMEDVYIRYITAKSKEFRSGLSNSEIVRFEINTFNTDGLDKLYEDKFPTIKKDINLTFRRMTNEVEAEEWESIYTSNTIITNMMYDHNFLSQTDTIKLGMTIYDKD